MEPLNKLESDFIELWVLNGIGYYSFKRGINITLEIAKTIVEERLVFTDGKDLPLLVDARHVGSIDRQARDYLDSDKGRKGVLAAGILIDSVFSTYLANFFMKITVVRPKIPTRLFTNQNEAYEWLQMFVVVRN